MFWALFWTFISKLSNIFYSKTCKYGISGHLNDLMTFPGWLFALFILLLIWKFTLILTRPIDYLLIAVSLSLRYFRIAASKNVYEKEKISAIVPFSNVSKVVSVFLWIIILWEEMSAISLVIFVIVFLVMLLSSINLKSMKFSRHILLYIFAKFTESISDIIVGYILIYNSWIAYYATDMLMWFVMLFWVTTVTHEIKKVKELPKDYFKNSILNSIWRVSSLISVLMIKEMGLSVSIMLSFLWVWISLALSYFILKDVPTKKNLIVTLIVTVLVIIWFLLK